MKRKNFKLILRSNESARERGVVFELEGSSDDISEALFLASSTSKELVMILGSVIQTLMLAGSDKLAEMLKKEDSITVTKIGGKES